VAGDREVLGLIFGVGVGLGRDCVECVECVDSRGLGESAGVDMVMPLWSVDWGRAEPAAARGIL